MQIFWTEFAKNQINDIYDYYNLVAGHYIAKIITNEILAKVERLEYFPDSGTLEPNLSILNSDHKYILVTNYKVIYRIIQDNIYITDVFDTRQSPNKITRNKNK